MEHGLPLPSLSPQDTGINVTPSLCSRKEGWAKGRWMAAPAGSTRPATGVVPSGTEGRLGGNVEDRASRGPL